MFQTETRKGLNLSSLEESKHRILQTYAKKYKLKVFFETGTYLGNTVEAMKNKFKLLYSIELNYKLYKFAKNRFKSDEQVEIIFGDSGKILGKTITKINQPILFWLDGHHSMGITAKGDKDTPIIEELIAIINRNNPKDVILIDDARCFGSLPNYPTIIDLKQLVKIMKKNVGFSVENDIIRITQV